MRHTRPLALSTSIVVAIAGLAGTAFALTTEDGTSAPTKSGRTSKQAQVILDRYDAAQEQAEVAEYIKTLDDQQKYFAALAAQQEEAARVEQARKDRAAALATTRASRNASTARTATVNRAPAYGPWSDLINQYPWPTDTAYRVMMCESHGDANAYNPRSGATGLFQILDGPYDPAANVALAFRMWQSRGWQPWRACV